MENQKKIKILYAIVSIFSALILILGGYIIYDKIINSNNKLISNENNTNNIVTFPIESGYTKLILNDEERKEINTRLAIFNVENSINMFPFIPGDSKIGDDLFLNDCTKIKVASAYVEFQLNGTLNNAKYPSYDYCQQSDDDNNYVCDLKKLKSLASIFFGKEKFICNEEFYNQDFYNYDPNYVGGGWSPIVLKAVDKYKNGNNYYLILHLYDDDCLLEKKNNCYELDNDITKEKYGAYFKLKYYKTDNIEYMLSLEYLKGSY
ncbi:MAG: hypothetical protein ACI4XR_01175 [Bacilli bacterium]